MELAVGTYTSQGGPGIAVLRLQGRTFEVLCTDKQVDNPIWLAHRRGTRRLYAACASPEDGRGMVAGFAWEDGRLALLGAHKSGGEDCCHLTEDAEGTHIYAANYADGSLAVFPIEGGSVQPACQHIRHTGRSVNENRQQGPHVHQAVFRPGTDTLFVCDLGADRIAVYERRADGTLAEAGSIAAQAGTGPRHLLFDGPERFYLVGELEGWVSTYRLWQGQWTCLQCVPTCPHESRDANTAAAIRMDAEHVYVSNRGHDSIAAFRRHEDGTLGEPVWIPVPGKTPRDFRLYEGGFLVAHQEGGGVAWIDARGNVLASVGIPGAVCLCPLE